MSCGAWEAARRAWSSRHGDRGPDRERADRPAAFERFAQDPVSAFFVQNGSATEVKVIIFRRRRDLSTREPKLG